MATVRIMNTTQIHKMPNKHSTALVSQFTKLKHKKINKLLLHDIYIEGT